MRYVYPYYYKEFECIGGDCPDTCCAGWDVDVDDNTAWMYKAVPLPIGERLRDRLRGTDGTYHFELTKDKRCPFLNDKNLCDLILALGDGGMCVTCTEYPRFYADTPIYEQVDLTLSCPEAARIFFRDTEPVSYITEDIDEEGKEDEGEFGDDPFGHEGDAEDDANFEKEIENTAMDPADEKCLLNLLSVRNDAISLMQNRALPLEDRWNGSLEMLNGFGTGRGNPVRNKSEYKLDDASDDLIILANIKEMETVNPLWDTYMDSVRNNLDRVQKNIGILLEERSEYLDFELERFLTYLIFRYAIDIYYHRNPKNTILFMRRCFRLLLLLLGEKLLSGDVDSDTEMRALLEERARIFSRQVEHSDDNVKILLK